MPLFSVTIYFIIFNTGGLKPDFSVPPPPIPPSLMHQPPPSMNQEYGQEPNPVGYNQVHIGGLGEEFGNDNDSCGNTLYSPTKPTVTPTKSEMNVKESSKNVNKGKLNMGRKCSKRYAHELLWIFAQLLMDILKFS